MPNRKKISIVIPVYNEAENIDLSYSKITEEIDKHPAYDWEILYCDNHSTDDSFAKMATLCDRDERVKAFKLSRNFGYQKNILTGYLNCTGDAAIQMDCDLQDPPALMLSLVHFWEQGYKVVYGIRKSRKENFFLQTFRKIFYRLIDFLSEYPLPKDAGDFRLIDRVIIDQLKELDDQTPYLRGTITEMGFNQIGFEYDRQERQFGTSKFNFKALMSLALDGVLNHSVLPLRMATWFGLILFFATLLASVGFAIGKIYYGKDWPAGFATLAILLLFSFSVNSLLLGVLGEYIARIFKQTKKRPLSIIESKKNFT